MQESYNLPTMYATTKQGRKKNPNRDMLTHSGEFKLSLDITEYKAGQKSNLAEYKRIHAI